MLTHEERDAIIQKAQVASDNAIGAWKLVGLVAFVLVAFAFFWYHNRLILGIGVAGALALPILSLMEKRARYRARMIYELTKLQNDEEQPES